MVGSTTTCVPREAQLDAEASSESAQVDEVPGILPCFVEIPFSSASPDPVQEWPHFPPCLGATGGQLFEKSLTCFDSVGDREAELALWQDLEREQSIEAALQQRLSILETEILECTESEQSLRSEVDTGLDGEAGILGSELDAMCEAVAKLRSENLHFQEELAASETKEAELQMELWQLRFRLESIRSSFRKPLAEIFGVCEGYQ